MTQPPIPEGEIPEIIQILTEIEQSSTSGDPLRDIAILKAMATDLKNKLKNSQSESQAGGEWISVDERLPELGEKVIVYFGEIDSQLMAITNSDNSGNTLFCVFYANCFTTEHAEVITHWKPLPEKPTHQ